MSASKYTFKELLQECKVEIPVLQRDYVQGNSKDKKAESIGKDFAGYLCSELKKEDPSEILLSFVYGKKVNDEVADEIEKNRENLELLLNTVSKFAGQNGFEINSEVRRKEIHFNTFIPFDGQQRLTTLFILHFLVYSFLGKETAFLANFLYKTRETSRDFLAALLENKNDFKKENWYQDFTLFINDRPWFYKDWNNDPTVESMISMLEKFRKIIIGGEEIEKDIQNIYENLEAKNTITFDYLNIEEHELDDLLYLKMNASGLDLTDYEKFKSWLIETVEKSKKESNDPINISISNWKENLDTVWYDLFWEQDSENTDQSLFNFFKQITVAREIARKFSAEIPKEQEEEGKKKLDNAKRKIFDILNSKETVTFDFFENYKLVNSENLNFVFNVLDFFKSPSFIVAEKVIKDHWNSTFFTDYKSFLEIIVKRFCNADKETRFNLTDRTFVIAILNYFNQVKESAFNEQYFAEWIRVIRNLVYNSRIDDSSQYFLAIESIIDFGDRCLNVLSNIKNEKFIAFFSETQQKEEYLKYSPEFHQWQNDFKEAENHNYFYGQIGFIIKMSEKGGIPDLNNFRYYYKALSEIYSENNLKVQFLIGLAFLTLSDIWMPSAGSERWLFCLNSRSNVRNRNENWRQVFNNKENQRGVEFLKDFINENINNLNLKEIIELRKNDIYDWRRLFLDYPQELNYCSQGLIKYHKNGNYIRLLGASQLNHYHRELRTSVLFNQQLKNYFHLKDDDYKEQRSDVACYIEMKIGEESLRIKFEYELLMFVVYRIKFNNKNDLIEEKVSDDELKNLYSELDEEIGKMNTFIIK